MTTSNGTPDASNFELHYYTCRNISGPEDEQAGRKVYAGHAPTSFVVDLEDNENVREYLADALGTAKAKPTLVQQAIRKTLADHPDQFSILNGGIVIVARAVEVDDKNKFLHLKRPSIINGSHTRGELLRYLQARWHDDEASYYEPSIKFELIVTTDEDLVSELSISRNFQNDVRAISIAGRQGQLDELEAAVQRVIPGAKLRKSETDLAEDEFLDTEKLIQVLFALMPQKLFALLEKDATSKVFAYSQKTRCLKLFQRVLEGRQSDIMRVVEGERPDDAIYAYFLDMAGQAWQLYEKWKSHPKFRGAGLRSIERENGEVAHVPDGIVFPILGALSEFVTYPKWRRKWAFRPVERFDEQELVEVAAQVCIEIADHNAQTMGKNKACYSALQRITAIYARLEPLADELPFGPYNPAFFKRVDELNLSVRAANCLKNHGTVYIGDLVQTSEAELMRIPNFGRNSVNEIKEVLGMMGLNIRMEVPDWPPSNLDELASRFEDHSL